MHKPAKIQVQVTLKKDPIIPVNGENMLGNNAKFKQAFKRIQMLKSKFY